MTRTEKLQRLALRYQSSETRDERDMIFSEICRLVMTLPVVRGTHRRTRSHVRGQSPRFADDEDQAIRRCVWRSLKRYDASYNVPYSIYITRGIQSALRDFWGQEAWKDDAPMHIPVKAWREYRKAAGMRARGQDYEIDEALYNACAVAPLHAEISDLTPGALIDFCISDEDERER